MAEKYLTSVTAVANDFEHQMSSWRSNLSLTLWIALICAWRVCAFPCLQVQSHSVDRPEWRVDTAGHPALQKRVWHEPDLLRSAGLADGRAQYLNVCCEHILTRLKAESGSKVKTGTWFCQSFHVVYQLLRCSAQTVTLHYIILLTSRGQWNDL